MVTSRRRRFCRLQLGVSRKSTATWWIGQLTVRVRLGIQRSVPSDREKAGKGAERSCRIRRKRGGHRGKRCRSRGGKPCRSVELRTPTSKGVRNERRQLRERSWQLKRADHLEKMIRSHNLSFGRTNKGRAFQEARYNNWGRIAHAYYRFSYHSRTLTSLLSVLPFYEFALQAGNEGPWVPADPVVRCRFVGLDHVKRALAGTNITLVDGLSYKKIPPPRSLTIHKPKKTGFFLCRFCGWNHSGLCPRINKERQEAGACSSRTSGQLREQKRRGGGGRQQGDGRGKPRKAGKIPAPLGQRYELSPTTKLSDVIPCLEERKRQWAARSSGRGKPP